MTRRLYKVDFVNKEGYNREKMSNPKNSPRKPIAHDPR